MESVTKLDNGKYEIHQDNGVMSATRNGEQWRDLSGDNLMYHLLMSHLDCECLIGEMTNMLQSLSEMMPMLDEQTHPQIEMDAVKHDIDKLLEKVKDNNQCK